MKRQYQRKTHPYTVVLLYPDYATGDYGADVNVTCVNARDGEAATKKAQRWAAYHCNCGPARLRAKIKAADMRMILVLEGDVAVVGDATSGWGLR